MDCGWLGSDICCSCASHYTNSDSRGCLRRWRRRDDVLPAVLYFSFMNGVTKGFDNLPYNPTLSKTSVCRFPVLCVSVQNVAVCPCYFNTPKRVRTSFYGTIARPPSPYSYHSYPEYSSRHPTNLAVPILVPSQNVAPY